MFPHRWDPFSGVFYDRYTTQFWTGILVSSGRVNGISGVPILDTFLESFCVKLLRFWMRLLLGWLTFGNFDFAVWVRSLVGIFGELATFGPVSPTSSLTEYCKLSRYEQWDQPVPYRLLQAFRIRKVSPTSSIEIVRNRVQSVVTSGHHLLEV